MINQSKKILKGGLFTIAITSAMFLVSCDENAKNTTTDHSENPVVNNENIVNRSYTDHEKQKLDIAYDNNKDIATINFNGEESVLPRQKSASGSWYANDFYDLTEKGNDVILRKNGKTVFRNTDEIVNTQFQNSKGDKLNVNFNNTQGTAKAYLNGGEQIDLQEEKAASGYWYKNDLYELNGKGNNIELKKGNDVLFEHKDDIVTVIALDENNNTLRMVFNNSNGTVKVYENDGSEINLKEKKAASGIWYVNDQYELTGKGNNYQLKKDNEVLFENYK